MSKIYIVDDEYTIRDMCYDLFKDDGHEVVTVPNGQQLMNMIQKERPDLILMDIQIPGEEGLSLLRRMPNQEGNRIPIIIFSGSVNVEIEKEAYRYGAVDVIRKGVDVQEFFSRVNKVLKSSDRVIPKVKTQKSNTILVVDDEESILDFLKEFLERKDLTVLTASSGEEALEIVKTKRPTMMLLDVTMPGMDGILTLRKIREIDKEIGVVMATGVEDEKVAQESTQLGAYAYVLKPFDLDYLEMVVLTRLVLSA